MHYSPFNKPISELVTGDLEALKLAKEGWYIEYKRESPNAVGIAKGISAFANTYGGWLFLGVEEESKENSVAGSFPGIAKEEVDPVLQRMRKAASDNINPTPHFESLVLWGPNADIGLAEDRAIVCVWIPQSSSAPHVHKSGQIYRRVSDASEPSPENDRFILDQLWRRSDEIKILHKEWFDKDPEFSKDEEETPYIRLMLIADPWGERDLWMDVDDEEIREVLQSTKGISSIPFDTVYTSGNGFVGRQSRGNQLQNLGLTWKVSRNLVSDVIIPLQVYRVQNLDSLSIDLLGYKEAARFENLLGQYEFDNLRIVDLNYLFNILVGVAEIQERLCGLAKWENDYYLKVKLLNTWRTIPFVDVSGILDRFEKHGLPMCLSSSDYYPSGTGPRNYIDVSRNSDTTERAARIYLQALRMFGPLAKAYGIPAWISNSDAEDVSNDEKLFYYQELQQAGIRAMNVQTLRIDRLRSRRG